MLPLVTVAREQKQVDVSVLLPPSSRLASRLWSACIYYFIAVCQRSGETSRMKKTQLSWACKITSK